MTIEHGYYYAHLSGVIKLQHMYHYFLEMT